MGALFGIAITFFFWRIINKLIKKTKSQNSSLEDTIRALKKEFEGFNSRNNPSLEPDYIDFNDFDNAAPEQYQNYPQAESLEITKAPYSNLEEDILDDVHLSKLPHNQSVIIEHNTEKNEEIFFDGLSPKNAYKCSIIFNRKHFKH